MVMDPLPLINKVLYILIQQERHMQFEDPSLSASISTTKNIIMSLRRGRGYRGIFNNIYNSTTRGSFNQSGRGRGQKSCTFCQITGHTLDTFYKKHVFPPGYQNISSSINNYVGQGNKQQTHQEVFMNCVPKEEKQDLDLPFTPAQHSALKTLIQQSISQVYHNANPVVCYIPNSTTMHQEQINSGSTLLEDDWCS
ncbi:hypothetical protein Lalb_Chr17g0338211 [Lupinus albus]|uniref:Uncharacterized protein n=1 Tax=Lupinus albus TaxID=3870 RepID=A0A6A4P1B3_LUPAL|nr:hypothetical protein Lalb_Chr17g0338211 [Lupinus albus]